VLRRKAVKVLLEFDNPLLDFCGELYQTVGLPHPNELPTKALISPILKMS